MPSTDSPNFRHSVRPSGSVPGPEVGPIRLLDRARAAPLGSVAITGAVATATFSNRRRFIAGSLPAGAFEVGIFSVMASGDPCARSKRISSLGEEALNT
jgi:hypothetical protein